MKIILRFYDEESDRVAEREFDWEEGMGSQFPVANLADPNDTIIADVLDNEHEPDGRIVCEVKVRDAATNHFVGLTLEDLSKYGFVEVSDSSL